MNQEQLFKLRNEIKSRVIHRMGVKENVINLNTHNSWRHEQIKCKICYELKKLGKYFITEAPLDYVRNRGIADILVLDDAQIIEIMVSETQEEIEWKTKKYPDCVEVIAVKSWEDAFNGNYQIIKHRLI